MTFADNKFHCGKPEYPWFLMEFRQKGLFLFLISAEVFVSLCLTYEYPTLSQIPKTGFVCSNHPPGYYADPHPLARCQVFHMCNIQGRQYSYLCPNHTLFHQERLICDHWRKVNCSNIESRWHINDQLYPDLHNDVDESKRNFNNEKQRNVDANQPFIVKNQKTNGKCGACLPFYLKQATECSPCALPR